MSDSTNLKATITVVGKDHVKECPTVVVGYGDNIPQILKLPCRYTGYRGLTGSVSGHAPVVKYVDLLSYIKSSIQATLGLGASVSTIPPANLSSTIHGFDLLNLSTGIHGFDTKDLMSNISTHPPSNLSAVVNIIEIRDFAASVVGEWWHGSINLGAGFYRIFNRGAPVLKAYIHSYDTSDLASSIASVYKSDLLATIKSTTLQTLAAFIYAIAPKDLSAGIHGFDISDLIAILVGGYGPNDLQARILPIDPVNLNAMVSGFKGIQITYNLRGVVEGWWTKNLSAYLQVINHVDLTAILNSSGNAIDLYAKIIPKVVHVKKILFVPLLEHLNLNAIINSSCFASSYKSLYAYVHALYKHDLQAVVWGWNSLDKFLDLSAVINSEEYRVVDYFNLSGVPEARKEVRLKVKTTPKITTLKFDTCAVYGPGRVKYLQSYINGTLNYKNLMASIIPDLQCNYSELPPYINPKTHEVVIKFDESGRERWRRFVEIMFRYDGDDPYHYFYVTGSNKIYKVDRTRSWTVWAYSYLRDDDNMIERRGVRSKFIFNLKNYTSIDEAIRELIDRVGAYREIDLSGAITAIVDKYIDLNVSISGIGNVKKRWVAYLGAKIVSV